MEVLILFTFVFLKHSVEDICLEYGRLATSFRGLFQHALQNIGVLIELSELSKINPWFGTIRKKILKNRKSKIILFECIVCYFLCMLPQFHPSFDMYNKKKKDNDLCFMLCRILFIIMMLIPIIKHFKFFIYSSK